MMTKHDSTPTLRERLGLLRRDDSGISIIEVLVAFLIFSVIAIGVAQATVVVMRSGADQRSRVVALNLAASEIDRARAVTDPGKITTRVQDTTVGNVTYSVRRTAAWVSASGGDVACGISESEADFQLRRVRVAVTWNGKLTSTADVVSDTLIAPDTQRDDPTTGRILIAVKKADGTPYMGVPVTIRPTAGGAAVTAPATDEEGCSYALSVEPGTYEVGIYLAEHLDVTQKDRPTETFEVLPGGTGTAQFSYDRGTRVNLTYPVAGISNVNYPTTLDWTLFNSDGSYPRTARPAQILVYPSSRSYNIVAGKLEQPGEASGGCVSPDPQSWQQATLLGIGLKAGARQPVIPAIPGATVSSTVPLGVAEVTMPSGNSTRFLTAVNVAPGLLESAPGCEITQTVAFGQFSRGTSVKVALPYGTWAFYAATSAGATTGNALTVKPLSNAYSGSNATSVTLDPRAR